MQYIHTYILTYIHTYIHTYIADRSALISSAETICFSYTTTVNSKYNTWGVCNEAMYD